MANRRIVYCIILLSLVLSSLAVIEPLCQWHGTAPFCFFGNSCPQDCGQVSTDNSGDGARCWIDFALTMASLKLTTILMFLVLLAMVPQSTNALCQWYGTAPFCFIGNSCPDKCLKTLESKDGDGKTCWFSHKNYCCCVPQII